MGRESVRIRAMVSKRSIGFGAGKTKTKLGSFILLSIAP